MSTSTRKATSSNVSQSARGHRASPYSTSASSTTGGGLQRQVSFGVANTLRRVADLEENYERIVAHQGRARVTRSQARKLEQYTSVQTRSRSRRATTTDLP